MYMTFDVIEPVLIIGLGGVGSKLAMNVKKSLNADCICISNDKKDLKMETDMKNMIKIINEFVPK